MLLYVILFLCGLVICISCGFECARQHDSSSLDEEKLKIWKRYHNDMTRVRKVRCELDELVESAPDKDDMIIKIQECSRKLRDITYDNCEM